MPIHSLNSDLLLHICMLLDVFTIISITRVNKYLRAIVSAKQLWISVVRDLSERWLIDPPAEENLENLSTAELIQQVKHGVVGPLTWSSALPTPPAISREISISLETLQGESSHVEFLPEGRHILFYKPTREFPDGVECWEVHSGRRVWGWASPSRPVRHATFDFRQGGSEAVVSLESCVQNHFSIVEADLKTGESHELLDLPVCARRVKISDDFFVCRVHLHQWPRPWPGYVLLVNWRMAELILFNSTNLQDFELFPGHIALTYCNSSTPVHVRIYSTVSFDHLWRRLNEFTLDEPTDPPEISHIPINILSIDMPSKPIMTLLFISESPVHNESYELVVKTTAFSRRPSLARRIRNRLTNTPTPSRYTTNIFRCRLTVRPLSPAVGPQSKSFFRHQEFIGWFVIRHQYGLSWGVAGKPVVYELTDVGIRQPRTLPIPVEAGVRPATLQLSRTGAMMVHLGVRIIVCYYL
ncbi:hypothetical protein FB451DRAFT_1275038 [Mycena latifolia]|nr:hypothetical protein FB451DRAFT_1275038 [Mycena latifolia]